MAILGLILDAGYPVEVNLKLWNLLLKTLNLVAKAS